MQAGAVVFGIRTEGERVSTPIGANTLSTDFDLMRSVAGTTDARNEEIRAMLQAFSRATRFWNWTVSRSLLQPASRKKSAAIWRAIPSILCYGVPGRKWRKLLSLSRGHLKPARTPQFFIARSRQAGRDGEPSSPNPGPRVAIPPSSWSADLVAIR